MNYLIDSLFSFSRVLVGVLLAVIIGVTLAVLRFKLPIKIQKNKIINFLIDLPRFPPPIAWIPLVILIFGVGEIGAYIIVLIGAVSPVFISTYEGLCNISFEQNQITRSFEIKGIKYFFGFLIPINLPYILAGVKTSISMGWMSVIAAEMVTGQSGLGYSMQLYRLNLNYKDMIINMLLIGLIGYLLSLFISHLSDKLLFWVKEC